MLALASAALLTLLRRLPLTLGSRALLLAAGLVLSLLALLMLLLWLLLLLALSALGLLRVLRVGLLSHGGLHVVRVGKDTDASHVAMRMPLR